VQEVLGHFQERLAYSEEPVEDLAGERELMEIDISPTITYTESIKKFLIESRFTLDTRTIT
jgi:hypothetical protein